MVSVLPSKIQITTLSGAALEEERYNEGADLQLTCTVSGGNYTIISVFQTEDTQRSTYEHNEYN